MNARDDKKNIYIYITVIYEYYDGRGGACNGGMPACASICIQYTYIL
jgi:hypothetical protein